MSQQRQPERMNAQELSLWERYREGDVSAQEALVLSHLKLVRKWAKRISRMASWANPEDLMQDGVNGLINAIENFDPNRGVPFAYYATFYIRRAMFDSSELTRDLGRQDFAEGITTSAPPSHKRLMSELKDLLAAAREASAGEELEEHFADEMSSALVEYGNVIIIALADRILSGRVRPDVAAEILDLLGRVDDAATYRHRLWLLERALTSTSTRVRHGASMGIAYLRDPHAVRYLKSAIESEPVDELKKNLQQVLNYVESVL